MAKMIRSVANKQNPCLSGSATNLVETDHMSTSYYELGGHDGSQIPQHDDSVSSDAKGAERDLYDGKRLPSAQPAARQLLPAMPVCMKEMSRHWSSPFKSKLPTKGFSMLETQGMGELGLAGAPTVESLGAYHLHLNCSSIFASFQVTLPGKMDRLTALIYQRMYKYTGQSVCSLNAVTLLSAYQAEILEEIGQQLDSGSPNPYSGTRFVW